MKQTYEDDLTKALRCLGSQNAEGDCYEDSENMRRWESGEKLLMCAENPEGKERCPYHQSTYGCCFEEGECMEWLGKAADEIVSQREELEELRVYKESLCDISSKTAKSIKYTIEMLQRLAFNIHGVMDVVDCENVEKICDILSKVGAENDQTNSI